MNIVSLVFSCVVVMVDFFLRPNVTVSDDALNSYKPAYNWIEIGCYLVAIPLQAIFVPIMEGQYLEMMKEFGMENFFLQSCGKVFHFLALYGVKWPFSKGRRTR